MQSTPFAEGMECCMSMNIWMHALKAVRCLLASRTVNYLSWRMGMGLYFNKPVVDPVVFNVQNIDLVNR